MQAKTILISNRICPFAQRARLTLQQKKIPYTLTQVSLTQKSEYFTTTYKKAFGHDPKSDGKVPILIDDDKILTESDLISWYLSEKYQTGTQLIPKDSFQRAKMRFWIGNVGKLIGGFYGFIGFKNKSEEDRGKILGNLDKTLQEFNDSLVLPYVLGNNFTLADILSYPWFPRWCALQKLVGVKLDQKYTRIHEWIKNIQQRDSAKAVRQADEYYIEGYSQYFK